MTKDEFKIAFGDFYDFYGGEKSFNTTSLRYYYNVLKNVDFNILKESIEMYLSTTEDSFHITPYALYKIIKTNPKFKENLVENNNIDISTFVDEEKIIFTSGCYKDKTFYDVDCKMSGSYIIDLIEKTSKENCFFESKTKRQKVIRYLLNNNILKLL